MESFNDFINRKRQGVMQCEHCGKYGFIEKELIKHNKGKKDEKILCHKCHIEEHRTKGAAALGDPIPATGSGEI